MKTVGRLLKDGTLYTEGELDDEIPVVRDGLDTFFSGHYQGRIISGASEIARYQLSNDGIYRPDMNLCYNRPYWTANDGWGDMYPNNVDSISLVNNRIVAKYQGSGHSLLANWSITFPINSFFYIGLTASFINRAVEVHYLQPSGLVALLGRAISPKYTDDSFVICGRCASETSRIWIDPVDMVSGDTITLQEMYVGTGEISRQPKDLSLNSKNAVKTTAVTD